MKLSKNLLRVGSLAIVASMTTFASAQDEPSTDKPADKPTDRPTAEKRPKGERDGARRSARRGGGDPLMAALDADKNRELSTAEIDGAPTALLALDTNKDGSIGRDELRAGGQHDGAGGGMMARLDKNKDGKLALDELPESMQGRFAELDKNADGFLTEDEMKGLRGAGRGDRSGAGRRGDKPKTDGEAKPEDGAKPEGARPERGAGRGGEGRRGRGQGGRDGRGGQRGGGGSALARAIDMNKDGTIDAEEIKSSAASLKALDKNNDGKLTRDEVSGSRSAQFMSRLDKDGDGKISREEAPGRLADRFDDIDTDADGFIDSKEMDEMMKNFRRGGGRGRGGPEGGRPRGKQGDAGDE